ncbi:MAG: acetyltransferase [bacterium]|nr:acetyltransferase [bacterium]
MEESLITFRRLQKSDLNLMFIWLNEAHVHKWWGQDGTSQEEITEQYIQVINGKEPTRGFIISYNEKPIGYIQTYTINDYPEYVEQLDLKDLAGMDIFIGDKDFTGKGLGAKIIKKFTKDIVFPMFQDVSGCIADPATLNSASIGAFQKAGFEYLKDSYDRETGEKEVVLILKRS